MRLSFIVSVYVFEIRSAAPSPPRIRYFSLGAPQQSRMRAECGRREDRK